MPCEPSWTNYYFYKRGQWKTRTPRHGRVWRLPSARREIGVHMIDVRKNSRRLGSAEGHEAVERAGMLERGAFVVERPLVLSFDRKHGRAAKWPSQATGGRGLHVVYQITFITVSFPQIKERACWPGRRVQARTGSVPAQ